ncbi:phosphoribosylglycinamide formyltransferase 2, partial [Pseudomonas aeruginosa]|nr:phosphoribosylglycinamide formyltransferase 2 [Pseudomonas aeruginosa]
MGFGDETPLVCGRHGDGAPFCARLGHRQVKGEDHESWEQQAMSAQARAESGRVARA